MSDYFKTYMNREHARLETEIEKEAQRPMPDQVKLARLKKLKLAIKDQIAALHSEDLRADVAA